jgi:hypothetical protein
MSMITSDGVPLLKIATEAAQRTTDAAAVEGALDDLHNHIFGATVSADASAEFLLHNINNARSLLGKAETATKSDLDSGRLLLDAVFTLSEALTNAIRGQRVHSKLLKRLEDVVLPILFIRSSITPQLLKTHALKVPWAAFEMGRKAPSKEVVKLELIFATWSANHGWDFSTWRERCLDVKETVAPALFGAKPAPERKTLEQSEGVPDHQRAVLRDISWNTAAKRSAGPGIPSYLLTKRRHIAANLPVACSSHPLPSPPDVSRVDTALSHNPHTTIDNADAEAGSTVLAVKSPVKRRRIEFTVGVPPSPDRPGRAL